MKKSMIYRVLIYIAGLLILAMESYRRFRIVFTEVSDLRRTVLMCLINSKNICFLYSIK